MPRSRGARGSTTPHGGRTEWDLSHSLAGSHRLTCPLSRLNAALWPLGSLHDDALHELFQLIDALGPQCGLLEGEHGGVAVDPSATLTADRRLLARCYHRLADWQLHPYTDGEQQLNDTAVAVILEQYVWRPRLKRLGGDGLTAHCSALLTTPSLGTASRRNWTAAGPRPGTPGV